MCLRFYVFPLLKLIEMLVRYTAREPELTNIKADIDLLRGLAQKFWRRFNRILLSDGSICPGNTWTRRTV
jgi:hypothetical protein